MPGRKAQNQATKSTTPSSQHHALVTVSKHRNLSPFAAGQYMTRTPSVLGTAWVKATVKHGPGAQSHQLVRHRRARRVRRQHIGGKALTSNFAFPLNSAFCRRMCQ